MLTPMDVDPMPAAAVYVPPKERDQLTKETYLHLLMLKAFFQKSHKIINLEQNKKGRKTIFYANERDGTLYLFKCKFSELS